jgi:PKD repeat protein
VTINVTREIPIAEPSLRVIQKILSKLRIAKLVMFATIKPGIEVKLTLGAEPDPHVTVPRDATWGYTPLVLFDLEKEFKEITGDLTLDMIFGAGIKDLIHATLSGGLKDAKVTLGIPPPLVKEITFKIIAELSGGLKWLKLTKTWTLANFKWTPFGSESFALMGEQSPLEWRMIERDWSATGHPPAGVVCPDGTVTLAGDVYPNSEVALRFETLGQGLLLSVQDDLSKAFPQGLEVSYSAWNSSTRTWSASRMITNDSLVDLKPLIEFDGRGKAVAVWQTYMKLEGLGMNPLVNLKNVDLRYAVWNGTQFSQPQTLTSNDVLDRFAALASDGAGRIMAVWVSDKDGGPLTVDDGDLYYALWDGASWSTPKKIAGDAGVASTPALVFHGGRAVLVFVKDSDGNVLTREDHRLYFTTFDGMNWSAIRPVTGGTFREESPSLAVDELGLVNLAWISKEAGKGERERDVVELSKLVDGSWSSPQPVAGGFDIGVVNLLIRRGYIPAVVWTDTAHRSTSTVYYSTYAGVWSEPKLFTKEGFDHLEMAVDIDGAASVLMAVTVAGIRPLDGSHIPKNIFVSTASLPRPANLPPFASFTYSPYSPITNQTIIFNASSSIDLDGELVAYQWDFGDGVTASGRIVNHTYTEPGAYTVTLQVEDEGGASSITRLIVNVRYANVYTAVKVTLPTGVPAGITAFTNSTAMNVTKMEDERKMLFTVEGPSGTTGTLTVFISNEILRAYNTTIERVLVLVDGDPVMPNITSVENGFEVTVTYVHSQHTIEMYYVTYSLTVLALNHEDEPLPNAIIRISGPIEAIAITNSSGIAFFEKVPEGNYTIEAYWGPKVGESIISISKDTKVEMRTEAGRIQAELETIQQAYQSLKTEYESLQTSHQELKKEYESLQASRQELKLQYDSLKAALEELESGYRKLMGELSMTKNLMYAFIAISLVFIATTIYFKRKRIPSRYQEPHN